MAGRSIRSRTGAAAAAAILALTLAAACAEAGGEGTAVDGVGPGDRPTDPVDFDLLRAVVPETIPGLIRREVRNVDGGVAGVRARSVAVEYGAGGGSGAVRLVVTDLGPFRGGREVEGGWGPLEVDAETETGYERTTRLEGHPALERYDVMAGEASGEVKVVVGRRFVVEARGSRVEMAVLRDVVRASDLARLHAIAAEFDAEAIDAEAIDTGAESAEPRGGRRLTGG